MCALPPAGGSARGGLGCAAAEVGDADGAQEGVELLPDRPRPAASSGRTVGAIASSSARAVVLIASTASASVMPATRALSHRAVAERFREAGIDDVALDLRQEVAGLRRPGRAAPQSGAPALALRACSLAQSRVLRR